MKKFLICTILSALIGSFAGISVAQSISFKMNPMAAAHAGEDSSRVPRFTPVQQTAQPEVVEIQKEAPAGWGTILAGIATAIVAAYGGVITAAVRNYLMSRTGAFGAAAAGLFGERIDNFVMNGMLKAADDLKLLDGKLPINQKSAFQNIVAQYVQDHGVDTIKKLGGVIGSTGVFDAIKARIEGKLLDPKFPVSVDPTAQAAQPVPEAWAHPPDFGDIRAQVSGIREMLEKVIGQRS